MNARQKEAFPYLYWGMLAQNHRGHQSHGFAVYNGGIEVYRELGLIPPLSNADIRRHLEVLRGNIGIANVRYATSGSPESGALQLNAMPINMVDGGKSIALSFNGNVVNIRDLQRLVGVNRRLSDAYVLCRLILNTVGDGGSVEQAARKCMEVVDGSYAITGITEDGVLFAFKDPLGIKPLCYGCRGSVRAFSSESVGLDINGIECQREIQPGEFMKVEDGEIFREQLAHCGRKAFCAFELAYFARPDSKFDGTYVYKTRQEFGMNLARRFSDTASRCDAVISLPETANDAAYGFHVESGLPWERAVRRHRYVTQRAFITPEEERENVISRKVNLLKPMVTGKRLAVIDDSIVRGDTTRSTVRRLRAAGADEIHLFITFPRIRGPCFYGIDMATYSELIGASMEPEEIAVELRADSVNYQTIEDYVRATGMGRDQLCMGCTTGCYPTPMANQMSERILETISRGEAEKGRIYESQ